MAFRTNPAPYQRRKVSTLQIMLMLTIALAIVWVFGIVYSFKLDGIVADFVETFNTANAKKIESGKIEALSESAYGIKSILMVIVSLAVTAVCDVLTTLIRHNKNGKVSLGKEIVNNLIHNYSYVTAIIFALTLPVYVSYYVVIIGAIFATVVVKNFFGGFGRNIFNPAIMARIFVGLCFVSQFDVPEILKTANAGIDGVTGATLTTAFNSTGGWLATSYVSGVETIKGAIFSDYTLVDMLTGNYVGALGETFTIVIFVLGVVLSILKVINWRTPVFYLGTVALTSLAIALFCGFSNPLNYVMYHLCLGGVMFGAVFMLTDPVTGPTSPFGKCLIGAFAGFMTVLIRVKGGYPEGVMYSIALCNFISPAIDYFTVGKSGANLIKKICFTAGIVVISIGLNGAIAVKANGGKEVYEAHGMDIVQYNMISETLNLKDGQYIEEIEDYTIKNPDTIQAYKLDEEHSLAAAYTIKDKDGNKIATAYSVHSKINVPEIYTLLDAYVLVAIDTNDKLWGFGVLSEASTSDRTGQINDYLTDSMVGETADSYADVAKISGSTFSTKLIKQIIKAAYVEHGTIQLSV